MSGDEARMLSWWHKAIFESFEKIETLVATSLNTLIQMVAGRMGSTLIPALALDQISSQSKELTAIHLNEQGPHRRITFLSRPNYIGVRNIECLMRLFAEQLNYETVNV